MDSASFRYLLYRYWFYGWLFRDVNRGSLLERAAAWRHNQAASRWLPIYLRRWTVLGLSTFSIGWWLESLAHWPAGTTQAWPIEALFFLPAVISMSISTVTLAAWVGLKVLPAP